MYAKLINGSLRAAPKKLIIEDEQVWNAPSEAYLSQGWKPVRFTETPEAPEGYYYESGWEEAEAEIVQTWTLVEEPDDIDDAEAFNIIFGEDA